MKKIKITKKSMVWGMVLAGLCVCMAGTAMASSGRTDAAAEPVVTETVSTQSDQSDSKEEPTCENESVEAEELLKETDFVSQTVNTGTNNSDKVKLATNKQYVENDNIASPAEYQVTININMPDSLNETVRTIVISKNGEIIKAVGLADNSCDVMLAEGDYEILCPVPAGQYCLKYTIDPVFFSVTGAMTVLIPVLELDYSLDNGEDYEDTEDPETDNISIIEEDQQEELSESEEPEEIEESEEDSEVDEDIEE